MNHDDSVIASNVFLIAAKTCRPVTDASYWVETKTLGTDVLPS